MRHFERFEVFSNFKILPFLYTLYNAANATLETTKYTNGFHQTFDQNTKLYMLPSMTVIDFYIDYLNA